MERENFHYRDNRNDSLFDRRNARFPDNRDNSASPINYRERIAAVDGTNNEMYQDTMEQCTQTTMLHHANR